MKKMRNAKRLLVAILSASMMMSECLSVSAATLGDNTVVVEDVEDTEEVVVGDDEEVTPEEGDEEEIVDDGEEGEDEEAVEDGEEDAEDEETDEEAEDGEEAEDEETVEEPAEETTEEKPEEAEMFPGLGDYTLSDEQIERKNVLEGYSSDFEAGENVGIYVDNQIIYSAKDEEEAEIFAKAFNGRLVSFDYGLAVVELNADESLPRAEVMDAVLASANEDLNLPAVWPNTIYFIDSMYENGQNPEEDEEIVAEAKAAIAEAQERAEAGETEEEDPVFYDEQGNVVEDTIDAYYNDPFITNKKNTMYQWHHSLIGSDFAWRAGYTGQGVNVVVIDTGILSTHEDFAGPLKGYTTSVSGGSAADNNGHGTNVSGLIASAANNGKGGSGVAPGCNLYSINASAGGGSFTAADQKRAIEIACDTYHAKIINMSLGGAGYNGEMDAVIKERSDQGVIFMCAAGNESTTSLHYPAGYKSAMAIGAVDSNNQRTVFSNYGGWVDYSAPGMYMYAPSRAGTSSYDYMNGTSQATPVMSGIAAVVISAGKVTGTGANTVPSLKAALNRGLIPSGVGKGTPHLGKILGFGTTETAPTTPAISVTGGYKPGSVVYSDTVSVKLNAPNCDIYYTTDGTNITYRNGVVSSNAIKYTTGNTITLKGKSVVMLKTIAVSNYNKLASRLGSYRFTLKPKVSSISVTGKNGISTVAKGGTLQMVAGVSPDYAANKAVTWTVTGAPDVTISAGGLLKVNANATATSVKVTATAKDGSGKVGTATISVANLTNPIVSIVPSKRAVTEFVGDTISIPVTTTLKSKVTTASYVKAVSSNTGVVSVVSVSGSNISLKGEGVGRATVTLAATDGSNKTATITVTVSQHVTGISISGVAGASVAQGRTIKLTANVSPANAANKRVTWSMIYPSGYDAKTSGVKVSAAGAVTASANAYTATYTVRATAVDNGRYADYKVTVIPSTSKATALTVTDNGANATAVRIFRVTNSYGASTSKTLTVNLSTAAGASNNYDAVSSNTDLVTVSKSGNKLTVSAKGNATGTAVVTVSSADGTNLKKVIRVTVSNPPTRLTLAAPAGRSAQIAVNRVLTINPVFETESGKIDATSKKLKWSCSNSSAFYMDPNGKVKALKAGASAIITATATDGSGVTATYNVSSCISVGKYYTYKYGYRLKLGYSGEIFAEANVSSSYAPSQFSVTVNRPGLSTQRPQPYMDGVGITVVGNAVGVYQVKVKPATGDTATAVMTVRVYK